MRRLVALLLLAMLSGCDLVDRVRLSPEERINQALPPEGAQPAIERLASLLTDAGEASAPVMIRWHDQLQSRALRCANGYKPSLLDSDDDIRQALQDKACFREADHDLLAWVHWRIAARLLATPPLRPLPKQFPAAIGVDAKESIMTPRFAAAAGVAVLQTSKQVVVVDLNDGQTLAAYPTESATRIGELSPNGRLLAIGSIDTTRFLDTMTGDVLLDIPSGEASALNWLDAQTAIAGGEQGRGTVLLDFTNGRVVPVPWMKRATYKAAALPGEKDVYTLVSTAGVNRMKLVRNGEQLHAEALGELAVEGQNNLYEGSFTPDGRYFISTVPQLFVVDVANLTLTTHSLYPLRPGLFETPGPGPNEMLIGPSTPDGRTLDLVYCPDDQTVRQLHDLHTQFLQVAWVPGLNQLVRRDNNRLVRIDTIESDDPVSLTELTAQAVESIWPAPAARRATSTAWVEGIGVYQGSSAHDRAADILVEVRPSSHGERVLVLSSYEAVRWRLAGPGVSALKAIYLSGYKQSSVLGAPASIPVKMLGASYAYQRGAGNYSRLDADVIAELGKGIDSFQGTYEAHSFIVGP